MKGINPGQAYGIHKEIKNYLDRIDQLGAKLKVETDSYARTKSLREQEEENIKDLRKEFVSLQKNVPLAKEDWKKTLSESEVLKAQINKLKADIQAIQNSIKDEKGLYDELKNDREAVQKSIEGLKEKKYEEQIKLADLQTEIGIKSKKLESIKLDFEDTHKQIQKEKLIIESLKEERERIMKENGDYKISLDNYRNNLNTYAARLNEHFKEKQIKIKYYGEN